MTDQTHQPATGQFDFDLFVIGAGSGGVRAARTAAATADDDGGAGERLLSTQG